MANDLFALAGGKVLVIGVGAAGCRIAGAGALDDAVDEPPRRVAWCAAHSNAAELLATGLDQKLQFDIAAGPFAARSAARSVAARDAQVARVCAGRSVALLAAAWGDEAVGTIVPPLARALRRRLCVCILASRPQSSGTSRWELDEAGAEQLASAADLAVCLQSLGPPAAALDVAVAARRAADEQKLLAATRALARVFSAGADGGFTPEALRGGLSGAGVLRACLGAASGPHAAARAAEAAVAQLDGKCREPGGLSGAAAAVLAGHELSVGETQDVLSRLRACQARCEPLVGSAADSSLSDDAVCLLLLRPAGSPNIVPLETARAP